MTESKTMQRFDLLDLGRFIAAFAVLLFHYLFRGWSADDMSPIAFPITGEYVKYGYLGVQFFFLISGFVIFMSIQKRTMVEFCIARIARLYPAYWASLALTTAVIFFWGGQRFSVDLNQVLVNLSMLQTFLMVEPVDGVYWSLAHELVFYFWMAVILGLGLKEKFLLFGASFLLLSTISIFIDIPRHLGLILLIQYSPYFVSGALFFLCYRDGFTKAKAIALGWGLLLAVYQVVHQFAWIEGHFPADWHAGVAVSIVMFFFLFFLFLVLYGYRAHLRYAAFLGALTYPLYLIHQNIGYVLFQKFDGCIPDSLLVAIVVAWMLLISWMIHYFIERVFGPKLKTFLADLFGLSRPAER